MKKAPKSQLADEEWESLVGRILSGRCTPFLGAGVASGILPLGGEVAKRLAGEYGYPYGESTDLIRVSQYIALDRDPMHAKERLAGMVGGAKLPDYEGHRDEPHRQLSRLPLPVYLTTNYDDLMTQALVERRKEPVRDLCRWTEHVPDVSPQVEPGYRPSPARPLVYHLHGRADVVESIVATEDDYLEFLGNILKGGALIPPRVEQALAGAALLFIGYQVADWNLRVILRGLARPGYTNYLVMPRPKGDRVAVGKIQKYLARYYGNLKIRVYWGTAQKFLDELFGRADGRFD